MFREIRRKRQALSQEETIDILKRRTSGVLAVAGDNGYPYAVPISYLYDNSKIYFHCAKAGHKLDSLKRNAKVSFCVIDQDQIVPEEYTTYFRSVIAFGMIRILENEHEKRSAIEKFALKYTPDDTLKNRQKAIEQEFHSLCMLEMKIEHMTGKEAIELRKEKY